MFLGKTQRIHFIGIGGSGMSGIAEVLINEGFDVSGSDLASSAVTDHLQKLGAKIHFEHLRENVDQAQVIVTSSAVKQDNPEVVCAREQMIPVIPRAEMLAELMRMKYGIAVAGTHGKTTTTSLISTALAGGGLDPTVVVGGRLKQTGGHAKLGQSQFLVAEADESDGSFLHLSPTIAVVTTLDEEHMDFYKTLDRMKKTFLDFINKVPFYGAAVLCLDDPNIQSMLPQVQKRYITYGLASQADYTARNIVIEGLKTYFNVYLHGEELGTIQSGASGRHNACNTLAAVAVGMELNLDFKTIAQALETFEGVQRRFEILHDSDDLIWMDDYGHHPAEIRATLRAAKEVWPNRELAVVFQPHRYSRTQFSMEDFWTAFNDADLLVVTDIYGAGETPIAGIDSSQIVEGARKHGHKRAFYIKEFEEIVEFLRKNLAPGAVSATLGAGNVWKLAELFFNRAVR
ncbi:MAG: UDP-N-acetylmuramate--L-alanine ligase [Candidatus Nitrohelix vancouverensis]|uniref:UDP-N-acetylmuramate--L-alanine ligase n=1 Tax=Candidatus Nitrohelix vancouverensis TaxID=2705534 RepID=A0A7T0C4W3_9BACT|nr:MAG: UDP-N-acetylmuramate--L-alanine ligase [Candidatus Nitrohelix vancouverensis]